MDFGIIPVSDLLEEAYKKRKDKEQESLRKLAEEAMSKIQKKAEENWERMILVQRLPIVLVAEFTSKGYKVQHIGAYITEIRW
jgi:adenylate kinase